ncbi:hypothetical protein H6F67_03615 [Microcoleus sp. FACHB-1515]|uniref:hypothetical protein n=1 Tax=Cyanophyceae TaxID=3028117 RepID=UPI00168968E4|nr:hypothetical protein [Microcoleus sp. FACHB-1515]MBD2088939.1 hypothetical protein [Microcoleus sp. FACHB-1515]
MSEANIPPTSGSPESASELPVDDSLVNDVWQDWQTVELPNSVNVDAIAPEPATDEPLTDEAQVTHLIELIQQLNECNTQLLDRVEQLEAAIEHSQTDLQTEIAHHQDVLAQTAAKENALQTQLSHLMQQLESSHQANQRQQILVETLTEQLENSQERIAQLERECSIAQLRCGEQAQKIVEVETTCRDLQIRLQRQQRYTMQFKVALNKCLDVPSPCEEAERSEAALPAPHALLPKVVSIRPWSVQPQFPTIDPNENLPALRRLSSESIDPPVQSDSDLHSTLSDWIDSPADLEAAPAAAETPVAEIVESIEAAEPTVIETIEITADMLHDLSDAPAELADDEAALWQDLARLIEVSTDDVVRASTAEDFAEFVQQMPDEPDWQPPASAPQTFSSEPPISQAPVPAPTPDLPAAIELPIAKSNWPSPVVYPLRQPTRKRQSLAAVELPSFPR